MAGVDIQGDGGMLVFAGGVKRKPLKANSLEDKFSPRSGMLCSNEKLCSRRFNPEDP